MSAVPYGPHTVPAAAMATTTQGGQAHRRRSRYRGGVTFARWTTLEVTLGSGSSGKSEASPVPVVDLSDVGGPTGHVATGSSPSRCWHEDGAPDFDGSSYGGSPQRAPSFPPY